MSESSSLPSLVESLCDSLRLYTALLVDHADTSEVIEGMDLVREAANRFITASVDETGWGSPFAAPSDDEDGPAEPPPSPRGGSVEVDISYVIHCPDLHQAGLAAIERLGTAGQPIVADELDTLVGIVHTLEAVDGWNPERYNSPSRPAVFTVLDKRWSIYPQR